LYKKLFFNLGIFHISYDNNAMSHPKNQLLTLK